MIKVLYVEDNEDNLSMLKMRLELLGDFEVLAAQHGEKGCSIAASERPEIILMDLEMPVVGLGSHSAAEEQSADERHPNYRVLRTRDGR